ncbi:MAG: preprotein translocase subunit SecA [Desulfobacteraceae bacterium]|nr:preprotein translocase subunit SecA [Desulfobacteraceae bacterium]
MSNASTAAITGALRPGLIAGRYPQRLDPDTGWADRMIRSIQGALARLTIDHHAGLHRVAEAIGRQGKQLTGLSNTRLENMLVDLRRRFRSRGLSDPLCIQAFALIREVSFRTLHKRHYDSQLMGGWVMLHGQLAEMETGEGKTLTATLAAAALALAGVPVHVITVNEYLVQRDAVSMGPLYKALGLTVGFVTADMKVEQRRAGYACDITYCTNDQVAFDYLRDRLVLGNDHSQLRLQLESAHSRKTRLKQFLLRGLCFAIVDEADSVLIDEARTPLILTRNIDSSEEHAIYRQALKLALKMENDRDFFLDPKGRGVQLSLIGQQGLSRSAKTMDSVWQNARRREELVCQALHALYLLHKDRDYLISDGKVVIVDANTGRAMPDRSWERGLHQLVEAKEDCPLTDAREQLGRLTYQRFFSRYLRIGGMTGTAREVSAELWSVYGLRVQRIPLHRPSQRRELSPRIFPDAPKKWAAVIASVKQKQATGQPVLIGTASVGDSESLSERLAAKGILHQVLNARQDKEEARIVAAAGQKGQVTVATNMAGRGTDIPLAEGVAGLGGLHVIAACRNDARRIDRQLYGRCARQGDAGSYQVFLSLEDDLIQQNCHPAVIRFLSRIPAHGGMFFRKLNLFFIRRAQRRVEGRHREARRILMQHELQTDQKLAFSGNME